MVAGLDGIRVSRKRDTNWNIWWEDLGLVERLQFHDGSIDCLFIRHFVAGIDWFWTRDVVWQVV
jgi:hypothetical protein